MKGIIPREGEAGKQPKRSIIDHFTVIPAFECECEAEVDLVLIQTSFLFLWKLYLKILVSIGTTLFT